MSNIIIRNLNKSFGEQKVIVDFSTEIKEGSLTCLMAPSGEGKTTLLRILMGLESNDSGEITGIEDKKLGVVFQEDRLCEELSAFANIMMVNKNLSIDEVECALSYVGLGEVGKQKVKEFSGGMKRRVAILRALMSGCDFLILDEPFKGLDDEIKTKVAELIASVSSIKTFLVVAHDRADFELLSGKLNKDIQFLDLLK